MSEPLETLPETTAPVEVATPVEPVGVVEPVEAVVEEPASAAVDEAEEPWTDPATDWPHEWVEFEGEKLAVRAPTMQALAAYSLAMSQFVKPNIQNDVSGGFMVRHMSDGTYLHIMDRLGDPDDADYDEKTIGELMKLIVELTTGDQKAENRAERRHPS